MKLADLETLGGQTATSIEESVCYTPSDQKRYFKSSIGQLKSHLKDFFGLFKCWNACNVNLFKILKVTRGTPEGPPGTEGVGFICGPDDIFDDIRKCSSSFVFCLKTEVCFTISMLPLLFNLILKSL